MNILINNSLYYKNNFKKNNNNSTNNIKSYDNSKKIAYSDSYCSNFPVQKSAINFQTTFNIKNNMCQYSYLMRSDLDYNKLAELLGKIFPKGRVNIIFEASSDGSEALTFLLAIKNKFKSIERFLPIKVRDIDVEILENLKNGIIGVNKTFFYDAKSGKPFNTIQSDIDELKEIFPKLNIDSIFKPVTDIPSQTENIGIIDYWEGKDISAVNKIYEHKIPDVMKNCFNITQSDLIEKATDDFPENTVLFLRNFAHVLEPNYVEPTMLNYIKHLKAGSLLVVGKCETDLSLINSNMNDFYSINALRTILNRHMIEIPAVSKEPYRIFLKPPAKIDT
jgi:chemotaxis methyl-accepting protein methylase